MSKHVPGEKRKQSLFSAFQALIKSSCSITALLLKLTHSLRKKKRSKICLPENFLSDLIGEFHINFTADNVFEILVSTKKNQ